MSGTALPAARIAKEVGRGETAAVTVVEEHLAAIGAGAGLNAFTLVDAERALARAARIDAAVAAGEDPGPLAGVPVALKDLIDHAGRPTTCGSGFYREVPAASAAVVERIEAAGGVVVGRTGLHEFAFGFSSENHWFGPVRNPWDPALSPGGSSGGSAVAVAAGMAALGVGTDTGGSVRVPAALCGIAGLKVTHGRVPLHGVFPLAPSIDTVGPLARTIGDLALLYRVMAGDDARDPWSVPRPVAVPSEPRPLAGLRVGVPSEWVDTALDADTGAGFGAALEAAAAAGAVVEEVSAPMLHPGPEITASFRPEVARVHRGWFARHPDRYGPDVAERMAPLFEADPDGYQDALAWRAALRGAFGRLLNRYDVLATPTVAARRKRIGEEHAESRAGPVPYRGAFSRFTALVNHASLPAIALPLASAGTPPPSLQLIGPAWGEDLLLAAGMALEGAGIVGSRPPAPDGPF
ncbi:MAG: amidase [Actinobacteria bacterium]|nr:amidase [Actinomycetota bacterium]